MRRNRSLLALLVLVMTTTGIGGSAAQATAASTAPTWAATATIYEVNVRQFSQAGTLNAVTTQLPRLHALGVDVLWFMPLTPISETKRKGTLGSPYSVADYTRLNPSYGTDADLQALVSQAHALGMHVIVDWVANHSGWDNPWITQHPDWYTHDAAGNIISPPGTDWTDVADLNYASAGLRSAMTTAMATWVTKYDIDGFRCDVASGVPVDFWNSATATLQAIKPLFMLAESEDDSPLLSQSFTVDYGWRMLQFMNKVGGDQAMAWDFASVISSQRASHPAGTTSLLFTTNHDENSWSGTEFKRLGAALPGLAVLQFLAPGTPLLYNGQEIGLNRQLAFFEKDPIEWPTNASKWTNFYAGLIAFRKGHNALHSDASAAPVVMLRNDSTQVISFSRQRGADRVIYVMNISKQARGVSVSLGKSVTLRNARTGKSEKLPAKLVLHLKPYDYRVWVAAAPTLLA